MSQTVTLKDIARKTNLSVASVSKALAGYPHVSKATQARVRAASNKLNYRPRAQRSSSRIKHRVKCLATEDWVMQSGQWLAALAMASRRCNVRLEVSLISDSTVATNPLNVQTNLIESWHKAITEQSHQADGILLFGCFTVPELQVMENLHLPYVVVGDMPFQGVNLTSPVHSVTTSKMAMGRHATRAMLEQGHKDIGFFCGSYPPGGWNEQWLHGYEMALRDANIEPIPTHCKVLKSSVRTDIGTLAARAMIQEATIPTAYVTPSVLGAACFKQAMNELGHPVAHDQLAMGGSVDEAIALGMQKTLLIDEPVEELAIHAIELLSRVIADNTLPSSQVLVPYHVHRRPAEQFNDF